MNSDCFRPVKPCNECCNLDFQNHQPAIQCSQIFDNRISSLIIAAGVGVMKRWKFTFVLLALILILQSAERSAISQEQPEEPDSASEHNIDDITPPEIRYDLEILPFPARRMRELLLEAAYSGDIEKLRPYIGSGSDMTMLSFGGEIEDPIEFLKSQSGDSSGHELLAILAEVLEAGFVRLDADTENEMFVWPYFYAWPLQELTPKQRVELYRIVTHGDYQDMEDFGAYIFYRIGITPSGRWRFFVAGD